MKNFLAVFVAILFILPKVAQADTLDDFKNTLASKNFLVKYKVNAHRSDYSSNPMSNDERSKTCIEVYAGNNFYIEENNLSLRLKIENKLFYLTKREGNGKTYYSSQYHGKTDSDLRKCALYYEVAEEIDFDKYKKLRELLKPNVAPSPEVKFNIAMQATDWFDAISALFSTKKDSTPFYTRTGSGTTEDGLEYFDLRCDENSGGYLNAVRYYFDNGIIKRIAAAVYYKNPQNEEATISSKVIEIEEFNAGSNPKYLKLPEQFKEIRKAEFISYGTRGN